MSKEQFMATGLTYGDMLISVGLDPVSDLINDLQQALNLIINEEYNYSLIYKNCIRFEV